MVWKAFYQIVPESSKVIYVNPSWDLGAHCVLVIMLLLVSRNTIVGKLFFIAVATPESVKNILCQVFHF